MSRLNKVARQADAAAIREVAVSQATRELQAENAKLREALSKANTILRTDQHSPQCEFEHFCAVHSLSTDRVVSGDRFWSMDTEYAWQAFCWGRGIDSAWA